MRPASCSNIHVGRCMLERCSIWAEIWLSVTSIPLFLICSKQTSKQKNWFNDRLLNTDLWAPGAQHCEAGVNEWRNAGAVDTEKGCMHSETVTGARRWRVGWGGARPRKYLERAMPSENRDFLFYANPWPASREWSAFTSNLQVTHHGCLGMTMSGEQHGTMGKAAGSGTRQLSQNLICHLVLVGCQWGT